jgi:hypothetical protein
MDWEHGPPAFLPLLQLLPHVPHLSTHNRCTKLLSTPTTTMSSISPETKALEQTRQRLVQLSNSLASVRRDLEFSDPLPDWYVHTVPPHTTSPPMASPP